MKYIQVVRTRRHIDVERPVALGHCEIRSGQHQDHRAHGGMDIAENPHNARPPEAYGSRRAWRIESEIEYLATIRGERTMENGIAVGKVDCGARYHRHNMRREHLVLLEHHRML